jgi:hypothetical protein
MVKTGSEPTRRNINKNAIGPFLEACQETIKAKKRVWR